MTLDHNHLAAVGESLLFNPRYTGNNSRDSRDRNPKLFAYGGERLVLPRPYVLYNRPVKFCGVVIFTRRLRPMFTLFSDVFTVRQPLQISGPIIGFNPILMGALISFFGRNAVKRQRDNTMGGYCSRFTGVAHQDCPQIAVMC